MWLGMTRHMLNYIQNIGETMKTCFKCNEIKPLTSFYKHKGMADGRLNKCKVCNKKDVTKNREGKLEYYRSYDRERSRGGVRRGDDRKYRENNPEKRKAHHAVSNAIRDGRMIREDKCTDCGKPSQCAHHEDYTKPLEVVWLCEVCHKRRHM